MPLVFDDNTAATVTAGGTTTSDTSWTVSYTSGFPATLAAGTYFHVADPALPSEKVQVTAISGTGPYTWTVVRGDEGTTPAAHASGFTVQQVVTAGDFGAFAQLGALNTFTANPQSVGTSFATGQAQLWNQHLYLAANGAAPPTVSAPFIHLYGYCGGAAGNNGWDIGIDVANHGGGQDFYIGKITNNATADFIYINYATTAIGIGSATPPSDSYLLEIRSEVNDTMGCLALELGSGATGNLLTLAPSSDVPAIWVDSSLWVNTVAGGAGLQVRGEATNNQGITIATNDKTKQYTISALPSGNVLEFKYLTGAVSNMWLHTDGSVEHLHNAKFNAGIQTTHTIKSGNYTAATTDFIIGCNSSGAAFTVTLPTPPSASQLYIIKDENGSAATNNITVSAGAKTIDGAASKVINTAYGLIRAYTDGTNWFTF